MSVWALKLCATVELPQETIPVPNDFDNTDFIPLYFS